MIHWREWHHYIIWRVKKILNKIKGVKYVVYVGGDLDVMQSKGVDQVFGLDTGSIRQANRDVIEDELGPAQPVKQPITIRQITSQLSFGLHGSPHRFNALLGYVKSPAARQRCLRKRPVHPHRRTSCT